MIKIALSLYYFLSRKQTFSDFFIFPAEKWDFFAKSSHQGERIFSLEIL
jgi:hypothetical protein